MGMFGRPAAREHLGVGDHRAISTSIVGTDAWVALHGDLDLASVADVEFALTDAAARSQSYVFVELTGVTFIDAAGIGALVRAAAALGAKCRRLRLLGPADEVQYRLDITGTSEHFGIDANLLDQAEAAEH